MRRAVGIVVTVTLALCAACTLANPLSGYAGDPLVEVPDASDGATFARDSGDADADADAGPAFAVTSFVLVNADTATDVPGYESLKSGVTLPATPANRNIRAEVRGTPGSVAFTIDGLLVNTENNEPFYLCGDREGGVNACTLASGTRVLRAVPYADDEGLGSAGPAVEITFDVP